MNRLALFGTFEVENYGDRLFPIIFQKELSARLPNHTLKLYSPLGSISQNIQPIMDHTPLQNDVAAAFVIGGGDLISFSPNIAPFYKEHWAHRLSPHTACWALPAIHRGENIPLIWNAPGVPNPFSIEEAFLIRTLCQDVDYLSVRDELSATHLQQAQIEKEIVVVPDTICCLSKHFSAKSLEEKARAVFDPLGLKLGEPLIFQASPALEKNQIPLIAKRLIQLGKRLKRPILLLPIGYCHRDQDVLANLKNCSPNAFHLCLQKLDIESTAAVIAHGGCFLGASLHGNITAFSYGIPHVIYNPANISKLKGFAHLIQEPDRHIISFDEMSRKWTLLQQEPSSMIRAVMNSRIDTHFNRIAEHIVQKSCSTFKQYDTRMVEHHLSILSHARYLKERCDRLEKSNAWKWGSFLAATSQKLPFRSFLRYLYRKFL